MIPAFSLPVFAAEADTPSTTADNSIIVIAGSDFQNSGIAENDTSVVEGIIDAIQDDGYTDVEGFLFAGDYTHVLPGSSSVITNKTALQNAVLSKYPDMDADNMVFTQGNHDADSTVDGSTLNLTGAHDHPDGYYGVYALNEKDYSWHETGTEADTIASAAALQSYLDEKIATGFSKPIFIVSHIPLHYTMRTAINGDGRYAKYIFDVLNDSAAVGLNIIYLFGHHHSGSWLDSQGGSATYFGKGDKIQIAQASNSDYKEETLNFTYMNAGFVGYYNTTNTTEGVEMDLTMSVFEIRGNQVKISRYSKDGLHDVKSAGVANTAYTECWEPLTEVISSPLTVKLNALATSSNGVTVSFDNAVSATATEISTDIPSGFDVYKTYDIQAKFHLTGKQITATIPVDDSFDTSRPAVIIDHDNGRIHAVPIVNGRVTFHVDHLGDFTVAQTNVAAFTATGTVKHFTPVLASSLTSRTYYVIQNCQENLMLSGNSVKNNSDIDSLLLERKAIRDGALWYYDIPDNTYGRLRLGDENKYIHISTSKAYLDIWNSASVDRSKLNVFENATNYPGTFSILRYGHYYYLNQLGGNGCPYAAGYTSSGENNRGSRWLFYAMNDATVTFSVVPSLSTLKTSNTSTLFATVMADGVMQDEYTITYSSSRKNIAEVSADGVIMPLQPGRVTITATLTAVNDRPMAEPISVEIPINIYSTTKGETAASTSMVIPKLELFTGLQVGEPSGPFVITSYLDTEFKYLSGTTAATGYSNKEGLQLVSGGEFLHWWYFDGTHLRYNSPTGPYLAYVNNIVTLSTDETKAFNGFVKNAYAYLFQNTNISGTNQYLNQHGGPAYNTVGVYSSGNWVLYTPRMDDLHTLTVNPGNMTLKVGETKGIRLTSTMNGAYYSGLEGSWSIANTSIATVNSTGKVTAVSAGKTTATFTTTSIGGDTSIASFTISVPIEVISESRTADNVVALGYGKKNMTKITDLQPGVPSGPYVIMNPSINTFLTGNGPVDSGKCVGLEIVTTNDLTQLWYYDGTHLRYKSHDGPYLAYENGQVVLSNRNNNAFDNIYPKENSTAYFIANSHVSGTYNHLNQLGGKGFNAAGVYTQHDSSRWYFYKVQEPAVILNVTPDRAAVNVGETISLTPSVSFEGVNTSTYTINWVSSDTSVATVSSSGVITAKSSGRAVITGTLTAAKGYETDISVQIPVSVIQLTQKDTGGSVVTTVLGPRPVRVTSTLRAGSGPYLITNKGSADIITGTEYVSSPLTTGLKLKPDFPGDYSDLWYYDGTRLIYGDPNAVARYMVFENDRVGIGSDPSLAFDILTYHSEKSAFNITASCLSSATNKNLNQYGGPGYEAVGIYSNDATSNDGSAWNFYSLTSESDLEFSAYPSDNKSDLLITSTKKIQHSLKLDDEKISKYTVSYSVSDKSIVTVSNDGTIYPWKSGTVTVYVRLSTVEGETVAEEIVAPVTIRVCGVQSVSVAPNEGSLPLNASNRLRLSPAAEGADAPVLTVTYENGDKLQIPVINEYLSDSSGNAINTSIAETYNNVTVEYYGKVASSTFTLNVVARDLPDYPEYPDEGSVNVDKVVTGENFQASGLAKVELSVSGVPVKSGVDVIVMLDTSSSMLNAVNNADGKRINVLCSALNNMINGFQAKASDGTDMDIRVAVADFNGIYYDPFSPYYLNPADTLEGTSIRLDATGVPRVYTGTGLTADAFVKVQDMGLNPFTTNEGYTGTTTRKYTLTTGFGTNYDYAFDAIYQLGEAINDRNAMEGEDRELIVVFMSDGAPFQFNYFGSLSSIPNWSSYLMGTLEDSGLKAGSNGNYYRKDGKHWMAEAIKGERSQDYSVIRKNDPRDLDGDNFIEVKGLGAKLYSIGFCLTVDNEITVESMENVIGQIATDSTYAFYADDASQLEDTFQFIVSNITSAGSGAYFEDTMGDAFVVKFGNHSYKLGGVDTVFTNNKIQIVEYEVYTHDDYENKRCSLSQVGTRKQVDGAYVYRVIENVVFNASGTRAISSRIFTTDASGTKVYSDILSDGVISADNFWYNSNSTARTITLKNGKTHSLAPKTFYWNVDNISARDLVLSYYVYLTNAQGEDGVGRKAGVYDTNKVATLHYTNYLGNQCSIDAPIPNLAWNHGQVSYGFYLVDKDGNPITNKVSGATGSFAKAVKLTDLTKTQFDITANTPPQTLVASQLTVPNGYKLYDPDAKYTVVIYSDGIGQIAVTSSDEGILTTYVEGFGTTAVAMGDGNGTPMTLGNYAASNTVVWFAVVAAIEAKDDSVVIDFGLPVEIHPLVNDVSVLDTDTVLAGIGTSSSVKFDKELNSSFVAAGTSLQLGYGKAEIINADTGVLSDAAIRYSLQTMNMSGKETLSYTFQYNGDLGVHGYYYGKVNIIPATTIYFDDGITDANGKTVINYTCYDIVNGKDVLTTSRSWQDTSTEKREAVQDEDLVGDADSIYGFDSTYAFQDTSVTPVDSRSHRVSKFVTVYEGQSAKANFTFTGTGFDIISETNTKCGSILVTVTNTKTPNATPKYYFVNTYYDYAYDSSTGKWVLVTSPGVSNSLYQVPVIKVSDLDYSTYDVEIYVAHNPDLSQGDKNFTRFYLDGIRIYNPAGFDNIADSTIKDAYVADNEYLPVYEELRNLLIDPDENGKLDSTTTINGAMFLNGYSNLDGTVVSNVEKYLHYGPNNEVYIGPKQKITFNLSFDENNVDKVYLAFKALNGSYTIKVTGLATDTQPEISGSLYVRHKAAMYYDLSRFNNRTVILEVTSTSAKGIASITDFKVTHKSTNNLSAASVINMNEASLSNVLTYLNGTPELTKPEVTLSHPSAAFEDEVFYNVYFDVDDTYNVQELGLITFNSRLEEGTVADAVDIIPGAVSSGDLYMARTNGIPAKNMGDTVYLKAYAKLIDGSYVYSDVVGFNAIAYAKSVLAGNNEKAKALVVAMLNYGAAAQVQFGYNTDSLMNAGLTPNQQALVSGYSDSMISDLLNVDAVKGANFKQTGGFSKMYPKVSFEGSFAINYYAIPANAVDGDVTFYYWNTDAVNAAEQLTIENATGSCTMTLNGTEYTAKLEGISARQIDETFVAAIVYESNGVSYCSGLISYSLGAYCKSLVNNADAAIAGLAQATAIYGYYAKSFFAN